MVMDLARGKPTPAMAPSPTMPMVATAQCIGGFKDSMAIMDMGMAAMDMDMALARGRLSPAMAIVCIPTIPMVDMSLGMKTVSMATMDFTMVDMDLEDMEAMARGRLMLPMDMVDMEDMVVIVTLGMVMA